MQAPCVAVKAVWQRGAGPVGRHTSVAVAAVAAAAAAVALQPVPKGAGLVWLACSPVQWTGDRVFATNDMQCHNSQRAPSACSPPPHAVGPGC